MGIADAAEASRNRPMSQATFHKILYRAALVVGLLASIVSLPATSAAQEDIPQIVTGERKATRKKDLGPRALALLQVTASGKRSLVPIAILINGKFWDASAYKADPVPMALDSGTVYEAERAGDSQGLFTVGAALHSLAVNAQNPWIGTGAWVAAGTETKSTVVKAEGVPVGIDTSDQPPRLTKHPHPTTPAGGAAPASGSGQSSPGSSSTAKSSTPPSQTSSGTSSGNQSNGASPSSDEPPRLTKPAAASSSAPPADSSPTGSGQRSPASSQTQPGNANPAATKPGDAKTSDAKASDAKAAERADIPVSDSGTAEGNRPRLRRGKPAQSFADEEFPGYSKPGATPAAKAAKAAEADTRPVQTIPAISDAGGPEPHPFTFEWLKDEEGERRQQITALAKRQLRDYLAAEAKAETTTQPTTKTTSKAHGRHVPAAKAAEPIFSNVQMTTFDLWTNNQPIIVFRADAQMPPPAGRQATGSTGLQYSIALVARTDIYNNLQLLYSGVTDKYHLDVTPRLDLIDAVDADGDGRGELLFKETSDAGTGWVIYRATADKLWKMYDSLNPE